MGEVEWKKQSPVVGLSLSMEVFFLFVFVQIVSGWKGIVRFESVSYNKSRYLALDCSGDEELELKEICELDWCIKSNVVCIAMLCATVASFFPVIFSIKRGGDRKADMKVGEWGGVPCNPVSIEQPRMLDAVWGGWHTALHWQRGRSGCQWYPCNCWFSWNKKLHPKLWNLCLLPVRNLFNFHKGSHNRLQISLLGNLL